MELTLRVTWALNRICDRRISPHACQKLIGLKPKISPRVMRHSHATRKPRPMNRPTPPIAPSGAIDVSVNDDADVKDRDAIRAHLPHIAMMFGQGNVDAPMMVHDRKDVPGTATMTALKDKIAYRYTETAKGGRVDITTTDKTALGAVHEFLRFQIADHRTGDRTTVGKR